MRGWKVLIAAGVLFGISSVFILWAQNKGAASKAAQTLCPITGEKINTAVYGDHQGKRVYLCCQECVEKFKQDPAKSVKAMEDKGIILDAAQVNCPVMGEKIDRKVYADYGGRRIYFCCQGCIDKFNRDPQKYVKQMDQDAAAAAKAK